MISKKTFGTLAIALILMTTIGTAAGDDQRDWPKIVEAVGASITMYQPQIDSWEGNIFEARAAVSVVKAAGDEPVFGAIWITGHFETNKATRVVRFYEVSIPAARFPDAKEEQQQKLIDILEEEMDDWVYEVDLDRLLPSLDLAAHEDARDAALKHDPPKIIFKDKPAMLVLIDGEPKFQEIEDTKVQRVVNTPYVMVKYKKDFFLATDKLWFETRDITGSWKQTSNLPKEVAKINEQLKKQREEQPVPQGEDEPKLDTRIPEIVVSTVPAELIFIDGEPELEPIEGNDILEVSNTDSDVIFDITSQNYYVLLSGRWYQSKNLGEGPWEWVPNDEVPGSFLEIPADSDIGYLKASIAGTDESKEAMLEQSIPQTAAVKRGSATSKVEYDGEPKFEPIEGTGLTYGVNTASSVVFAENQYYWCEQGVWYVSPRATGPWVVCETIPDSIYTIPPSNPLYNVTYVKVYQATPEVIYVGYTPGYTGSYVSHSCVVYGTGYYYRPWYTPYYYYPRPSTWGFHVRYNPWYGWGFGLSYSTGPFHLTIGWGGYGGYPRYGGWWGPAYYRPYPMPYGAGYRAGYRAGYYHGRHHGSNRPVHYGGGNTININNNIYNRPVNRDRVVSSRDQAGQRPAVARDRANNVYTDRSGNVYRRNTDGSWDRRKDGGWSTTDRTPSRGDSSRPSAKPTTPSTRPATPSTRPTSPSTRPSTRPATPSTRPASPSTRPSTRPSSPSTRPSTGTLNRDYNARQRGSTRSSQMSSRPSSSSRSMSRPSTGARPSPARRR
ncbi:MAG: hypothetical protein K8R59_14630 [Thermoanaerobaculales bacterium]|nr:hypothetical protein [Thermoanaerobaculales bacterium]